MSTARRELLQLAQPYKPKKHKIEGWMVSEKLDGSRCFWDGGITRGMPTTEVPWAGLLHPKKGTQKPKIKPVATGLWSRYGNPIIAPDWFLDELPTIMLDGELWCGRGNFQLSRSIVAGDVADSRWDQVVYMCYGALSAQTFGKEGLIKNNSMLCQIVAGTVSWIVDRSPELIEHGFNFRDEYQLLQDRLGSLNPDIVRCHEQTELPEDDSAISVMESTMNDVIDNGGEGVIVRNPFAEYICKRTHDLIKFKPFEDDDGILVGFTAGRDANEGKIGALILDLDGKRLKLSGMKLWERDLENADSLEMIPGKDLADTAVAKHFKVGEKISFKYRELSDDGIPKEARYWRQRGDT